MVAVGVRAIQACPRPSEMNTAPPESYSCTAAHSPNADDPVRTSTTTSRIAPATQVTYLAWPGGTAVKWMPRMTPWFDVEQFACASVR